MEDDEMRREALQWAVALAERGESGDATLQRAATYYAWLLEGSPGRLGSDCRIQTDEQGCPQCSQEPRPVADPVEVSRVRRDERLQVNS